MSELRSMKNSTGKFISHTLPQTAISYSICLDMLNEAVNFFVVGLQICQHEKANFIKIRSWLSLLLKKDMRTSHDNGSFIQHSSFCFFSVFSNIVISQKSLYFFFIKFFCENIFFVHQHVYFKAIIHLLTFLLHTS